MNKKFIYSSLIVCSVFISCEKKKDLLNTNVNKDTITEIIYTNDPDYVLSNKNAQELIEHLENEQNALKEKLQKATRKEAEALYLDYYKKLSVIVDSINTAEINTLKLYHEFKDHKPDSVLQKEEIYDKVNLYFRKIDSNHYDFRIKPGYYYNLFHNKVSPEYKEYMKLRYEEHKMAYEEQVSNEKITLEKRRELIIKWEKFLTTYKNFKFIDYAKRSYTENLTLYLFGSSTQPTFEITTKKLYVENEQEYISFVKKNPQLISAEITKAFLKHFYENDKNFTAEEFYVDLKGFTKKIIAEKVK
ncbi:MAG TPA: hypothetical protein VKY82_05610 [Flavobacterium sp.]|nr:hypothetical protein [Flavobacterium sp.]